MSKANDLWMQTVLAEKDLSVGAGLPEEMREGLDRLNAARARTDRIKEKRARMERVLASIEEHEAKIAELQKELHEAMRDYAASVFGTPVGAATPSSVGAG